MSIHSQGARPTGRVGQLIGHAMNLYHTSLYRQYLSQSMPPDHSTILDIGCGGGRFLKFLAAANHTYQLWGIDHSPEMVELALRVNRATALGDQLKVCEAYVLDIPLEDSTVDVTTAFETIQFWPQLSRALTEVHRVLKPAGRLIIINRYPPEGSFWWKKAKLKSDAEYHHALETAGFTHISTDLDYRRSWIVVEAGAAHEGS
ncbi:MAG: class I SAM-dependent methyltransferase [Spirochaetota bacterium]